jgi:hypothetical protein
MSRRILSLLVVGVLIPACKAEPGFLPGPLLVINTQLRGSQVVPAVSVPVTTTNAALTVSENGKSINYSVNYTGSGTITAVEIRLGAAGSNGPLLFTLATAPFTNPLTGTLTEGDLILVLSQNVTNFADALNKIEAGLTYVLISTKAHSTGEMRGQLGAATLASAVLNGAQVVPPVAGPGAGVFTLTFDETQSTLTATLSFSGLSSSSSANSAHLRFGAAGVGGGPDIFDLSKVPFSSPLVKNLTVADFNPNPPIATFADAVDALLTGQMYVDVDTTAHSGGEIRGQIGPARLTSTLTDAAVVPGPVVSGFSGSANVILNATQTEALVLLTHNVLTPDSVGLYTENPGSIGPLLYDVGAIAGSAASPVNAILREGQLIQSPPRAILTFTDFTNALLIGKTYLDVRSPSFPAGAIRGQILP